MKKYYFWLFAFVIAVPLLLGLNAWQSNRCAGIRNEIAKIEERQENRVEENKTVVADIAKLLAVEKIEQDARTKLGLTKVRPEDVTLIIMEGKGRDL